MSYVMPSLPQVEVVIRCVRCWLPVTDDDDLIRTPFAATGQPSVAHRDCPETVGKDTYERPSTFDSRTVE